MEKPLSDDELKRIRDAAGEVTLAECMNTAIKGMAKKERISELAIAIVSLARGEYGYTYTGSELLGACVYICINQLLVPHIHEEDTSTKGFYRA